jgi:hypothetical protein
MDNNRVPNADNSAHSHSINHNNRGLHSPQKIPIRSLPKPNIITHFNKARARCLAIAKPPVQDSETYAEGLELTVIKLLLLLIAILFGLLLLPFVAVGLIFSGVFALLAWPLAIPLAGAVLIALGILLIIIGAIAILA